MVVFYLTPLVPVTFYISFGDIQEIYLDTTTRLSNGKYVPKGYFRTGYIGIIKK